MTPDIFEVLLSSVSGLVSLPFLSTQVWFIFFFLKHEQHSLRAKINWVGACIALLSEGIGIVNCSISVAYINTLFLGLVILDVVFLMLLFYYVTVRRPVPINYDAMDYEPPEYL